MSSINKAYIARVLLPVFLGAVIYCLLRDPSLIIFKEANITYNHYRNLYKPFKIKKQSTIHSTQRLSQLSHFFYGISILQKRNLLNIESISNIQTRFSSYADYMKPKNIPYICEKSLARAEERLNYKPKFLPHHFQQFFKTK